MERIETVRRCFELIGAGYRIRVPKAGAWPKQVEMRDGIFQTRAGGVERPRFLLDPGLFNQLVMEGHIAPLTENRNGEKLGWRECGYDGEVAEWYAAIQ